MLQIDLRIASVSLRSWAGEAYRHLSVLPVSVDHTFINTFNLTLIVVIGMLLTLAANLVILGLKDRGY